jgi:hypothetical protein
MRAVLRVRCVRSDANKLLQMFACWACEEDTVEHFTKAVLLRFVPLPPAGADMPMGAPSLLSLASHSVARSLDANPGSSSSTHRTRTLHTARTRHDLSHTVAHARRQGHE